MEQGAAPRRDVGWFEWPKGVSGREDRQRDGGGRGAGKNIEGVPLGPSLSYLQPKHRIGAQEMGC